ncbi:MAG: TetR family transcriptional regulator [Succinivibrio sp.]|nr:TetR family transcriptional regulator [Succinivibrio sp.]
MPKLSAECCDERKNIILDACATLYSTRNFKDICLKDISELAGCTRTTIYNYFENKEEIFLGLLKCEYMSWIEDLERILDSPIMPTKDTFADALAHTLEKRKNLLKLLSTNLYDIEENSRPEFLADFKVVYRQARETLYKCLQIFFKEFSEEQRKNFISVFFPFLVGIYPFCYVTEKQTAAMAIAKVECPKYNIYDLAKTGIRMMLG